jgi:hypothetical protein
MDWFVVRHPETGGIGVVAESALPTHRAGGWIRVSDAIDEGAKSHLVLNEYATAPDLDAPQPLPAEKPAHKTSSKES